MARIREVELPIKIYIEVLDSSDQTAGERAVYRIREEISDAVEKAINSNAKVVNREGKELWRLVGTSVPDNRW
jgi:hypothetical protein